MPANTQLIVIIIIIIDEGEKIKMYNKNKRWINEYMIEEEEEEEKNMNLIYFYFKIRK